MEITTELLNSIEGRPQWLGQWEWMSDGNGKLSLFVMDKARLLKEPPHLVLSRDRRVAVYSQGLESTLALELALYARRVEIEVRCLMGSTEPTG